MRFSGDVMTGQKLRRGCVAGSYASVSIVCKISQGFPRLSLYSIDFARLSTAFFVFHRFRGICIHLFSHNPSLQHSRSVALSSCRSLPLTTLCLFCFDSRLLILCPTVLLNLKAEKVSIFLYLTVTTELSESCSLVILL